MVAAEHLLVWMGVSMSADNYFLIRKHPLGGFALINASASDDRKPRAHKGHTQYTTVEAALKVARASYFEYGGSVDDECEWTPPLRRLADTGVKLVSSLRNEVTDEEWDATWMAFEAAVDAYTAESVDFQT
jgi:hypothetical protein